MATYRYIVTVETRDSGGFTTAQHGDLIQQEIDSNRDYELDSLNIEHFTVTPYVPRLYSGQGFTRDGQTDTFGEYDR